LSFTKAEKEGIYMNMEGRTQRGRKAIFAPGEAKEDWTILRALSNHIEQPLPFNNIAELRTQMAESYPRLGVFDEVEIAEWGGFGGAAHNVTDEPFVNPIENFYMTNVICHASETMRRCTEAYVNDDEVLEAAE